LGTAASPGWRTSSYTDAQGGNCIEVGQFPGWGTSTCSHADSDACAEVASSPTRITVRDTKDRAGATLSFAVQAWRTFAGSLKSR
jgi:hypothetical protein